MWESEQQKAFDTLKDLVTHAPVLAIYDPTAQLEVHTDASAKAIGAVLLQRKSDDRYQHPVAYFSRKLNQT